MELYQREFKRLFALSMYKDLHLELARMSFFKDFTASPPGDPYPLLEKSPDCREEVSGCRYRVEQGSVRRMFCSFFPFATYELTAQPHGGRVGLGFETPDGEVTLTLDGERLCFAENGREESLPLPPSHETLAVSCRPGAFDLFFKKSGGTEFFATLQAESFKESNRFSVFTSGRVSLIVTGGAEVSGLLSYIDNGVSVADIRPIKYENGRPLVSEGKVFLTASVRMCSGSFQGVFSWIPGTSEFELCGADFYHSGDGFCRGYLAPVIVYNRKKDLWYVWVSSFEHRHILAHAQFSGDPRFGINIIDVELMEPAGPSDGFESFRGFRGDEDPDLIFDESTGKWLLAVCRHSFRTGHYSYAFFASSHPFEGYEYLGCGKDGSETGGSFVRHGGELCFVCGNSADTPSNYRIYSPRGMEEARFDYPDGGYRGWGTVIPIDKGSRTEYYWLTFDRHRGSDYTWSYGNIHCFRAR